MPLRAYIDNEQVISLDFTDDQWNSLRKRLKTKETVLTLPCCEQEGFLRKSSKGLKHFVHSKSNHTCDWKPESAEHLKAKIEIIEACKENGWDAIPEFSDTNWRADVLAIQGEKKIAFEVQCSRQTFETTQFRQDRYKESNVRGCWLFRTAPKELRKYDNSLAANKEIPAFRIFKDENSNILSEVEQIQLPLKSLVDSLLQRKLKFCNHVRLRPTQKITIVFFETSCWKCNKPQHLYTVEQKLSSVCNQDVHVMGSMWDSDDIDKFPQVYNSVLEFLGTDNGKDLKIGQLKERYSYTVSERYLSHGCYHCDALFGDFYLHEEKLFAQDNPENIRHEVEVDLGDIKQERKHWCYSEDGKFCE